MKHTLILIIPSDWPHARRECQWLLHDGKGQIVQRGCSEPAHWPVLNKHGSDEEYRCELLLAGHQVACHRSQLPKGRVSPEIVAAALEDRVLDEIDQLHFAIGPAESDGQHALAVVSRRRLASIVTLLRQLGLTLNAAWPLGFALPEGQAWLAADELTLALPNGAFTSLPLDRHLADRLADLPAHETPLPVVIPESTLLPDTASQLAHAEASGGLRRAAPCMPKTPSGHGFLYGPLAPPPRRLALLRPFMPALRLAAGFAVAATLLATAQWAWHTWQAASYREAISADFRRAMPQAAMVDPILQMQRQIDELRRRSGQLADNDFLRLAIPLTAVSDEVLDVREMRYENGQLQLTLITKAETLADIRAAAAKAGLALTVSDEKPEGEHLASTLLLKADSQP